VPGDAVSDLLLSGSGLTRRYRLPRPRPLGRTTVRTALHGVDLHVSVGERVGVVGGSGAGKSTLLRLLLALEAPDEGEVRLRGRLVRPQRAGRLRWFRSEVQYVSQDVFGALAPRMSIAEIVREPLRCLAVPGDHDRRVDELLAAVRLDPALRDRRPGALSGGQRQRVAVARALAPAPTVLLADEPVSALDPPVRVAILDLLRDVSTATGTALVLVTHDLPAVRRTCDRVVVLHDGRVAEAGPVRQIFEDPRAPATRALLDAVPRLPAPAMSGTHCTGV
jgi:peptide/nickel transport system ATP-binding protein